MSHASVLMRFATQLDERRTDDIRGALTALAGVARVRAGLKLPRLMLVEYDPRVVSAQALRDALRDRGFAPQFVGN